MFVSSVSRVSGVDRPLGDMGDSAMVDEAEVRERLRRAVWSRRRRVSGLQFLREREREGGGGGGGGGGGRGRPPPPPPPPAPPPPPPPPPQREISSGKRRTGCRKKIKNEHVQFKLGPSAKIKKIITCAA